MGPQEQEAGPASPQITAFRAATTAALPLLVQQEPFYGVWQRQRGNQMESVLAKSSSHSHTAQIQQSPGDTWEAMGRNGEKEEKLIPLLTLRSQAGYD